MAFNPGPALPHVHPILLLTRPEAASRRFAELCGDAWRVVISPLMRIDLCDVALDLDGVTDIVFTSENCVRAFVRLSGRRDATAWCVGPATAERAAQAGFAVETGPGSAAALADLVRPPRPGRVLWPRGRHAAVDVGELLAARGLACTPVVLYEQVAVPASAEARAVLCGQAPVFLPLFSARSAALIRAAVPDIAAPLFVAAISPNVASAAAALGAKATCTAARPDAAGVRDCLWYLAAGPSSG